MRRPPAKKAQMTPASQILVSILVMIHRGTRIFGGVVHGAVHRKPGVELADLDRQTVVHC